MLEDTQPPIRSIPPWFATDELGCVKLVPLWDMFNHDPEPNCNWENDFEDPDHSKHSVDTTAIGPIQAGDELFINYG